VGASVVQCSPPRTAFHERNGVLEEVRNRPFHARNQNEGAMIAEYLIDAGQFIENPLVKTVALLLAMWGGYRFCGWVKS